MTEPHRSHPRRRRYAVLGAAAALAVTGGLTTTYWQAGASPRTTPAASARASADWVAFSGGRLSYRTDAQGDRVPDFSRVGYHESDQPIPDRPVAVTLAPAASGDDTARIQAAVERVGGTPSGGAVLLRPGTYRIGGTIKVDRSGVVLRGSGSGDGTVLTGTGKPHTLVAVGGSGQITRSGDTHPVTDTYVPVGASTLHVADAATHFSAGDRIVVQRPIEQDWIHAIGMDHIPPRPDGTPSTPWKPSSGHEFERTVAGVRGDTITLDVPLPQALEKQYTHASVWTYTFAGRISEAGVENLSGNGKAFESDPSWHGGGYFNSALVSVDAAENSWVRDVTANRFGSAFSFGTGALHDTMLDTRSLDASVPQDVHAQPVAYTVSGQQTLIENCTVTGSNQHAWATQARIPGPNVITNCTASNTGKRLLDAGPHQRWATGTLYDEITMDASGTLALHDRQWMGSGQGWAGANDVAWNCSVGRYQVEDPPTAHNWAIGCTGTQAPPAGGHRPGEFQSSGSHVLPASLYQEQLRERHGK
ncbi:glycosyl hydrolase family 28-related protein [Streptomyces sp. RPT161]|uniref:glycosyl hydrolase family 28-related protein n=1 Tax=Streptomyces sp. RPT161 TaxID=3015993 RepID=UPI0022B8CB19|nr:glycosyl hydrolase family 28-related protein [Streptomyces sp. RPT161]